MSDLDFQQQLEQLLGGFCDFVISKISARLGKLAFNPDARETYEVIGGLLSRQGTLCCELAKNPNAWTGHLAPLVLRAMADVYINIAWILLEPDKRSKDYITHALGQAKIEIEYRKTIEENEANKRIIEGKSAWLNSQQWDFLTEVNFGSWSGKNVRQMAQEAQCEDFYRLVYEPFSACVHSTWQHVEAYNTQWCDNSLHIPHRVPKEVKDAPDPFHLMLAAKYIDKTFGTFDKSYGIQDERRSVRVYFEEAFEKLNTELKNGDE